MLIFLTAGLIIQDCFTSMKQTNMATTENNRFTREWHNFEELFNSYITCIKLCFCCIKGFPKILIFEVVVRNLRYFARDRTYIYATRL